MNLMPPSLMNSMTDRYLVTSIRNQQDPLTTSDAERELLNRFESVLDRLDAGELLDVEELEAPTDKSDIQNLTNAIITDADNTVAILRAVADAGFDNPESLTQALEIAKAITALDSDARDAISSLANVLETL